MSLIHLNFQSKYLSGNTDVNLILPDLPRGREPGEFYQVFDRFERPVIEARNQIAAEIGKEYLEEASFLKGREKGEGC